MSSPVICQIAEVMKRVFDYDNRTIEQIKQDLIAMDQTTELTPGTTFEKVTISSYLTAEWIRAANVPKERERVILFFPWRWVCFSQL
ncbi:MAG: hypothetical protein WC601_03250 [Desulfotomaculaceae bacterium]